MIHTVHVYIHRKVSHRIKYFVERFSTQIAREGVPSILASTGVRGHVHVCLPLFGGKLGVEASPPPPPPPPNG